MKNILVALLLVVGFSLTGYGQENNSSFIADPMPSYPGGTDSLSIFLKKNIKKGSHLFRYSGKVFIVFDVNSDGSLSDFEILMGLCEPCDQEIIDVFKKMPNWIPAERDSIPIKVRMIMPLKIGF